VALLRWLQLFNVFKVLAADQQVRQVEEQRKR
jgi:hypothetical protein